MNVAIIGAGLMGSGIAQVFLVAGHDVIVHDRDQDALKDSSNRIRDIFDLLKLDPDLDRLVLEEDLEQAVVNADFVIEAIVEDLEIKMGLFRKLSESAPAESILASNTSSIPITQIAAAANQPARVVGTHFWNPPWAVDLVEVIQGEKTSSETVSKTMQLLSELQMQPVHVKRDVPGCIGNRLQHALKREAISLVENGICDAETVDTVVKRGFGQRLAALGPLEQSDMLGLDLTLRIHETLMPDLDRTPEPAPLLRKNVAEGNTGMATGRGFRKWTPETAAETKLRLSESLAAQGRARVARLLGAD